jgi:hypothetical protein
VQFVRKIPPFNAPGSDVLIPGRVTDDIGFVDTGMELDGLRGPLRIYLSAAGIRAAAEKYPQLGLVDSGQLSLARERRDDAEQMLRDAQQHIADLEETVDRIAGLSKAGFTVQKKMGAPAKKATPAAAKKGA